MLGHFCLFYRIYSVAHLRRFFKFKLFGIFLHLFCKPFNTFLAAVFNIAYGLMNTVQILFLGNFSPAHSHTSSDMKVKAGTLLSKVTGKLPIAGRQHKNAVSLLHCLLNRIALGVRTDILSFFVVCLKSIGYFRVIVSRNFDIIIPLVIF